MFRQQTTRTPPTAQLLAAQGLAVYVCVNCHTPSRPFTWSCSACSRRATVRDDVACLAPEMLQGNDGSHEPLFEGCQKLQADRSWFVHRRRLIVWALQRHFPQLQSFLEIGCGTAESLVAIADRFRHAKVCGGEPSLDTLQIARRRCGAKFLQMGARTIPFVEAFEVVGIFDIIEHIDDNRHALSEMYKACRRGGGLILTVLQRPRLQNRVDDAAKHKRRYIRRDLIKELHATGSRSFYVSSFMSLLLPVMVFSHLHQEIVRTEQEVNEGLRIGKTLGRLFSTVCNVEPRLLTRGIHFPAGGSLLAIAVKEQGSDLTNRNPPFTRVRYTHGSEPS